MIGRYITLEELMKRFDPQLSVLCIQLSELAGAADAFLFLKRNATLQEREQALVFPAKQVPSLLQLVTAIAEDCQKVALPYSALGACLTNTLGPATEV